MLLRGACALVLMVIGFAVVANAQTEKTFPTDAEINLVLTQTERAIQQYKPLIDQEEIRLGTAITGAVANDRQVVNALEMVVKALKGQPKGFNGPAGFALFRWLDDADRNAVLCAGGASAQSMQNMMAGNLDKASAVLHLSQSCTEASALIYTVSESVGSLYERYVEAEEQLAAQGIKALQQCTDILKKNK